MLSLCDIGGGVALWKISGAAVDRPLIIPCMQRLDCWNSWAIVPKSTWRWMVWWMIVVVDASNLWYVGVIIVVRVPNFSSSLFSRSFIVLVGCFLVMSRLGLVTLFMT